MREFELLKHVYAANPALPARVTIPPGDDMGALRLETPEVLVTVDQLVDGLHFDLATTPLEKIARKAITRNLSDVAAMAAVPAGAVAAACLPRDFGDARARRLFDLMRLVAQSYDCPLIGGDISMWDHPLVLTLTVLAESRGVVPVLRKGAREGDVVCVTGELGGSLLDDNGRVHHLDFEPRLKVARALASNPATRPHCMLDLSDGLARDLGHLCDAAEVGEGERLGAELFADRLPIRPIVHNVCDGRAPWVHALADGEDYELCFTIDAARAAKLPRAVAGCPITQIGRIILRAPGSPAPGNPASGNKPAAKISLILSDGSTRSVDDLGWEHHGP
ncbi:MAG: thiamine-phosphate kinase [Planctomycetota bacterium]|nr:thiamine-phosphate kinase [Planctomycetota bacterium]